MQADESRACKRREQALEFGINLVEVSPREAVLLYGGGILALHDLTALFVFLPQSVLHLFGEPVLYELCE